MLSSHADLLISLVTSLPLVPQPVRYHTLCYLNQFVTTPPWYINQFVTTPPCYINQFVTVPLFTSTNLLPHPLLHQPIRSSTPLLPQHLMTLLLPGKRAPSSRRDHRRERATQRGPRQDDWRADGCCGRAQWSEEEIWANGTQTVHCQGYTAQRDSQHSQPKGMFVFLWIRSSVCWFSILLKWYSTWFLR